jgi:glyoxylase-like metal-dependent hydrolase (beta-lactamase superfamily II)
VPVTHNAHAPGHTALWLPAARVLIAGDMLSDVELPLLEQSSPADYAEGLAMLRPYVEKASAVIPGHGSPAIGAAAAARRWAADRRYLDSLQGLVDRDEVVGRQRTQQESTEATGDEGDRLFSALLEQPDDDRLDLPGMAEAHWENRAQARPI